MNLFGLALADRTAFTRVGLTRRSSHGLGQDGIDRAYLPLLFLSLDISSDQGITLTS